ncbi:MAG: PilN domain-containing protein [Chromatiaceae bacterium]|nr:PilN domain-containing protein [Chromatiaceae bacterium]
MARINLLPWREAARQQRKTEFAIGAGIGLAAALAVSFAVHTHFAQRIDSQQQRNQRLKNEIAQLNRTIKEIEALEKMKADLITRMNVIQNLQESRPEVVHLFDELVATIPAGVYLTRVDHNGRSITIEGRAQSNARVSALMRNIEAAAWVDRPRLMLIENKEKTSTGLSHFRLSFDQVRPKPEQAKASG